MLPSILKRAVMLLAVCLTAAGVIFFCAGALQNHGNDKPGLRVGYTAEKNPVTALAVSYIQNMESVRSLCSLEPVTEQEGRELLQEGELSALIVLPGDVVNEILSGSNTPATLYLPPRRDHAVSGGGLGAVGSMLFEELASAAIGMLETAQAEIYASDAIVRELSAEYGEALPADRFLQSVYDDVNQFNLQAAAGREKLFRKKILSLTENDTYAVYYGSALFTIYMMLAGLFLTDFGTRSSLWQTMADRRLGVGYAAQLAAGCLAGGALMLVVLLLPFLALTVLGLIPRTAHLLTVAVTWQGLVSLLLIICFMTVYFMLICQIAGKHGSALVVTGIAAVLQAYLSGCLIPSVLLPGAVVSIGKCLPAAMVKKGFTILFTGDTQSFPYVAAGLCAWGAVLFLCTVLLMGAGKRDRTTVRAKTTEGAFRVPPLVMVVLRRLLHRKSMWISLGLIVVLSAAVGEIEQNSETQIRAAVCDESGAYAELLEAYDGVVAFEQYGSEEAVRQAVLRGRVECGYILPADLTEQMTVMNGEIVVCQGADAIAVPVVNEILFERIFRQVSLRWFEDYIAQNDTIRKLEADSGRLRETVRECFNRELQAGTTFRFEVRRVAAGNASAADDSGVSAGERRTIYPVYVVAAVAAGLCALQGVLQAAGDVRKQYFYKRNRLQMSLLTLLPPLLLGGLCALLVIMTAAG